MPTGGWKPIRSRSISYSESQRAKQNPLAGPLRVVRLCVLSIVFPGLLLGVPLYMRYNVYTQQFYPIGMSDIRLLDSRISTVWCQKQVVWSNATYNAYLLSDRPEILAETKHVSMTRQLVLDDDMKEYWGFYLLKGSTITVSACVRWPGASLIMIRGHKHLKQCAYIGDNSSEELDELEEAAEEMNNTSDDPSNKPHEMKKIMEGVVVYNHTNVKFGSSDVSNSYHRAYTSHGMRLDKKAAHVHLTYADQIINPKQKHKKGSDFYQLHPEYVVPSVPKAPETSRELYEDLLKKLNKMGNKGKALLEKLNQELQNQNATESDAAVEGPVTTEGTMSTAPSYHPKQNLALNFKGRKRELGLDGRLQSELTRHDEDEDHAMEEEAAREPDGISEIHGKINETNPHDKSNSEFWSSFSSSEERLLQCEGLLLNLPLTPHRKCEPQRPLSQLAMAAAPNTMTYTVPSNGYYFFVFNSENEIQSNFIHVHFRLEKTTYNISQTRESCKNQTGPCSLPLKFWSNDKVVIELPVRKNDSLWNQEFLAVSTCEPRTSIYIGCVIAVPLLIILFAFQ
uniref:E3 ubiquitin-protein ligase APD1-4 middle domain-containing protein n=1 Tax=Clastoptera arizonana TaxID=38151 RepID=A0A1B6DZJ1_9HEMI